MGYLLLITFSGSAMFGGYLCWERLFKNSITQCMKYRALTMVLVTYIIPWAWLKSIYGSILGSFWFEEAIINAEGMVNIADIKTGTEAYKTKDYNVLTLFVVIWFVVALSLMIIKIVKYLGKRRALQLVSMKCCDKNLEEAVKRLNREVRCRRKPEIVGIRVDSGTLTLGAIKPIIFLQKKYEEKELYLILKHEMIHVARMDLLIKLVAEFVCCLHWFNPLVYWVVSKMEFMCESSCDERVINGCTEDECTAYVELLGKNKKGDKRRGLIGNGLENSNLSIEKRIEIIKKKRTVKYRDKMIVIGIFILLVLINSLTAVAYPKIQHIKNAEIEYAEDLADGGVFWLYDYKEDGYDIGSILYDEQFVDGIGHIYPVVSDESNISCTNHKVESGYYQKHIRYDDNSCIVELYEATRCTKCGDVEIGGFYLTTDCDVCIH